MHPCRREKNANALTPHRRRAGFTFIELLTVIGILSLLAAISLPAVQRSRESALRVECGDHLRQIMVACQAHATVHQTFPTANTQHVVSTNPVVIGPSVSAFVHLLPYIERGELYVRFDFSDLWSTHNEWGATDNAANRALLDVQISLYVCPSESAAKGISYRSCSGPAPYNSQQAPFVTPKRLSLGTYTDGLSQTAMFSERPIGDGDRLQYNSWSDVFHVDKEDGEVSKTSEYWQALCAHPPNPPDVGYSFSGINWLHGGPRHTAYNHVFTPNSRIPDCADHAMITDGGPGAYTARSYHDGGVNVTFADGHVDFVGDSIDVDIWQALATRNGDEPIGTF